jgi:hypothetical protein
MHFGLSIINTENASLQINALMIKNIFGSRNEVKERLGEHYL